MFSCVLVAAVLSGPGGNQASLPSSPAAEAHVVTKRTVLFPGQKFATGGWGMGIDAADLDGDGLLDLVTSLWSENEVSVLIGKPGGAFREPVRYPSGEAPFQVAVGDLDGDGRADVVGVNQGYPGFTDGNLTVHKLIDGRAFTAQVPYVKSDRQTYYGNILAHLRGEQDLLVSGDSAAKVINVLTTAMRSHQKGGVPQKLA